MNRRHLVPLRLNKMRQQKLEWLKQWMKTDDEQAIALYAFDLLVGTFLQLEAKEEADAKRGGVRGDEASDYQSQLGQHKRDEDTAE